MKIENAPYRKCPRCNAIMEEIEPDTPESGKTIYQCPDCRHVEDEHGVRIERDEDDWEHQYMFAMEFV